MKREIKFYRLKMEIPVKNWEIARYYSKLMYIEHDKPFCKFYFENEKIVYMVEITLKRLMENLPPKAFFQCNRQTIINIGYYRNYCEKPPTIIMDNGKELNLSYRKITTFKKQKAELVGISPLCNRCYSCSDNNCLDLLTYSQANHKNNASFSK